jgi:hypothetical protein
MAALRTIGAYADGCPLLKDRLTEVLICRIHPQVPEARRFADITHPVPGVLVKTTGNNASVPRDHTTVPHFPAMVEQPVFKTIIPVPVFPVPGIFDVVGDE